MSESQTLDRQVTADTAKKDWSKVVNTAINMVSNYQPIKNEKDDKIERVRDLYLTAVNGEEPDRLDQMPSYLLNQIVETWLNLIDVPDTRLVSFGTDEVTLQLMSRYLEKKVKEGGFNKMLQSGFGGYRQQCLDGDFFVLCGQKQNGVNTGMPDFRGLSSGGIFFNDSASVIRGNTYAQPAYRCGVIFEYDVNELDWLFPGMRENATPGNIPEFSDDENPTNDKTDNQQNLMGTEVERMQVMYFWDISDKENPVFS